jgi:hypothetical protein
LEANRSRWKVREVEQFKAKQVIHSLSQDLVHLVEVHPSLKRSPLEQVLKAVCHSKDLQLEISSI